MLLPSPSFAALVLAVAILHHQAGVAQSANILFYAAFGSQSTRIAQMPLMEALADKGHNVTYFSPLPQLDRQGALKQASKVHHIVPTKLSENVGTFDEHLNMYEQRVNKKTFIDVQLWIDLFDMGRDFCDTLYSDSEHLEWITSNKFDLVIMDTCNNECAYGPIHLWNAKYVLYQTSTVFPYHYDPFGIPDESSSIPDMTAIVKDRSSMTFIERFFNQMIPIVTHIYREYYYLPYLEETSRKGLGKELSKNLPSFNDIDKNVNLKFLTSHHSIDYARSLPPNVIPIGGNVVAKKAKALPKDMKDFLDSSANGFIYVSFGTVAEFTAFDEDIQAEFIAALGQFPHINFLWKAAKPITAAPIPDNVFLGKWIPQQSVLTHPKIIAYITHSGMGSTVESIHFSVPLICVPLLADQDVNAGNIVAKGAGVKVEIVNMKRQDLAKAIAEMIQNKAKYQKGMDRLSAVFKDRMAPPLETAIWWVEYLLRHENTNDFLLSPSARQPWWKRRQIDVWVVATLLLLTITIAPVALLYFIVKKIFGGEEDGKQKLKSKLKKN